MSIDWIVTVHVTPYCITIEGAEAALRWGNSYYRKQLRRLEKNRPLKKDYRYSRRHIALSRSSDRIVFDKLHWIVEQKLFHLISAIPVVERDRHEIYPAEFSGWVWRKPEKCRLPGLGLRDYSEPARLLFYGRYEPVIRQKAASPARYVWASVPAFAASPETQQILKRIGRLYKNSCWWPKLGNRRLFDRATASSWKKLQVWKPGQLSFEWDPKDEELLEKREARQISREGGQVLVGLSDSWDQPFWLRSHNRHVQLERTRATYNDQRPSFLNSAGLGRKLREHRSLNIPRETIVTNGITNRQYQAPDSPDLASEVA